MKPKLLVLTNNKHVKFDLKWNTFNLRIPQNEILRYKSNQYVQDLYKKNYKTLKKKIKNVN